MKETSTASHKDAAISFLRLVVAGKIREAYARHIAPEMRHHNMAFVGDAISLEKAMEENHALHPCKVLDVKRALEDRDIVAVHSHIRPQSGTPGFAAVHIFRFAGDRIIEIWDIGQAVSENSPNANGMF